MARDDACMFCGQAPCECAGKKKAKPKAPAKKKVATPAPKAANLPKPAQHVKPVKKKLAAPAVNERKKVVATPTTSTSSNRNLQQDDSELWQAITNLVAEDMLPPKEIQRVLTSYPRRPL